MDLEEFALTCLLNSDRPRYTDKQSDIPTYRLCINTHTIPISSPDFTVLAIKLQLQGCSLNSRSNLSHYTGGGGGTNGH